jgi:hypothetical protein
VWKRWAPTAIQDGQSLLKEVGIINHHNLRFTHDNFALTFDLCVFGKMSALGANYSILASQIPRLDPITYCAFGIPRFNKKLKWLAM